MTHSSTKEYKIHFQVARQSRKALCEGEAPRPVPVARIPRISRLMALALRFEQLLRDGVVANQSELAQLGHVTTARLTQIMNLLGLAPDIQEEILFLPASNQGRDCVWERKVRDMTTMADWREQRRVWEATKNPIR